MFRVPCTDTHIEADAHCVCCLSIHHPRYSCFASPGNTVRWEVTRECVIGVPGFLADQWMRDKITWSCVVKVVTAGLAAVEPVTGGALNFSSLEASGFLNVLYLRQDCFNQAELQNHGKCMSLIPFLEWESCQENWQSTSQVRKLTICWPSHCSKLMDRILKGYNKPSAFQVLYILYFQQHGFGWQWGWSLWLGFKTLLTSVGGAGSVCHFENNFCDSPISNPYSHQKYGILIRTINPIARPWWLCIFVKYSQPCRILEAQTMQMLVWSWKVKARKF